MNLEGKNDKRTIKTSNGQETTIESELKEKIEELKID